MLKDSGLVDLENVCRKIVEQDEKRKNAEMELWAKKCYARCQSERLYSQSSSAYKEAQSLRDIDPWKSDRLLAESDRLDTEARRIAFSAFSIK